MGSVNDTPSQQQVYVVSTDGEDRCLTCEWVVDGDNCEYASASFSTSLSYHVRICSGPNPIYVQLENTQNVRIFNFILFVLLLFFNNKMIESLIVSMYSWFMMLIYSRTSFKRFGSKWSPMGYKLLDYYIQINNTIFSQPMWWYGKKIYRFVKIWLPRCYQL